MISGSCHCGAVRLEVASPPQFINECQCSICRRYGARWAYYPAQDVRIHTDTEPTLMYQCSDRVIEFHHCATCACMTHWQGAPGKDQSRLGINMRMFDPVDVADAQIEISFGPER